MPSNKPLIRNKDKKSAANKKDALREIVIDKKLVKDGRSGVIRAPKPQRRAPSVERTVGVGETCLEQMMYHLSITVFTVVVIIMIYTSLIPVPLLFTGVLVKVPLVCETQFVTHQDSELVELPLTSYRDSYLMPQVLQPYHINCNSSQEFDLIDFKASDEICFRQTLTYIRTKRVDYVDIKGITYQMNTPGHQVKVVERVFEYKCTMFPEGDDVVLMDTVILTDQIPDYYKIQSPYFRFVSKRGLEEIELFSPDPYVDLNTTVSSLDTIFSYLSFVQLYNREPTKTGIKKTGVDVEFQFS